MIIIFDDQFEVKEACQMPHNTIKKYVRHNRQQNEHILLAEGAFLADPAVENIKFNLRV